MPVTESVSFWDRDNHHRPWNKPLNSRGLEAGISDPSVWGTAEYVRSHLDRWRLYHFHDTGSSSPLKKTASLNDNSFFRPDGSNLAAFLYYLRKKHEASYRLIVGAVQRVAPFLDDFQLDPARLNPDSIRLEWRHKNSEAYFDVSSLSDGTLRFIALATLFLQPESYRPSVILVDEPELGLHPYAITMLASLIKQAAKSTQVIVGTQSALLLDHFQPEDMVVADRVGDATQLTRLDSPKLEAWLEDYSLGQLWEKNELGGRPKG
ncbi:MAG TPA: AAA family ATPase [Verrucomicrobiae bacterium]